MGWADPRGASPGWLLAPPVGREDAARAARRELGKNVYARYRPSLFERVVHNVGSFVVHLLDAAPAPRGVSVLLLLIILAGAALLASRVRAGRTPRRAPEADPGLSGPLDSASYRRQAAACADVEDWRGALLAQMRALTRSLEERGVLQPQPGRTAAELAAQAGQRLTPAPVALVGRATRYDEVRYGGWVATGADYRAMLDLDRACRQAQPRPAGADAEPLPAGLGR